MFVLLVVESVQGDRSGRGSELRRVLYLHKTDGDSFYTGSQRLEEPGGQRGLYHYSVSSILNISRQEILCYRFRNGHEQSMTNRCMVRLDLAIEFK